jgi:hypothetical protein
MLELSQPLVLFDYFRVPYRLLADAEVIDSPLPAGHPFRGCGEVRWTEGGASRSLYWMPAAEIARRRLGRRELRRISSVPLFGHVLDTELAAAWAAAAGPEWHHALPLTDARGRPAGAVWQDGQGSLFLPFDPNEAIENYWTEGYRTILAASTSVRVRRALISAYYRVRPLIPRAAQIALRRAASGMQMRTPFPSWPVDPSLHGLYDLLFRLVHGLTLSPLPWLAPWPAGYRWALVLTHDVETRDGYEHLSVLRDVELEDDYRSAWNFVPRRYDVDDAVVAGLAADGFEVGVHGLYHDGRDLERASLPERLPAIRLYAERWGATGFRSPAARRDAVVIPRLGFGHDSSFPDTDPFGPDGGGCCSWLPYFNGDLVELPITLPQDHTLFEILRHDDGAAWHEKTDYLRRQGGMALLITHPDYMREAPRLAAYRAFLRACAEDGTAWRALPREVAAWWRRRAASRIELVDGEWCVVGPAAGEAAIHFFPERAPAMLDGAELGMPLAVAP